MPRGSPDFLNKPLLKEKLDAPVIQSPSYFHPEQAAARGAAGKQVYFAKPIVLDVPRVAQRKARLS
jgi:predicted dehydrogenase